METDRWKDREGEGLKKGLLHRRKNRHTEGKTNRKKDEQTDRRKHRHMKRKTYRVKEGHTDSWKDIHIEDGTGI